MSDKQESEFEPEIGTKCHGYYRDINGLDTSYKWRECIPLYDFGSQFAVKDVISTKLFYCDIFRPLKTESEVRREDAINKMIDCVNLGPYYDTKTDCLKAHEMTCEQLHDAGYIDPNWLTDEQIDEFVEKTVQQELQLSLNKFARLFLKHIKGRD